MRRLLLYAWAALLCCVVVGSLLPAASQVIAALARLHVSDKLEHFSAYLALSSLAVVAFATRRTGIAVGLSMFLLGLVLEAGQSLVPGRAVEVGDVVANGLGVALGILVGIPARSLTSRAIEAPGCNGPAGDGPGGFASRSCVPPRPSKALARNRPGPAGSDAS